MIRMEEISGELHHKAVLTTLFNSISKEVWTLITEDQSRCGRMAYCLRDSEADMRRIMIEDLVECVISLGPNLFYNSSMTSCLLVTNNNKQVARKGKDIVYPSRRLSKAGKNYELFR